MGTVAWFFLLTFDDWISVSLCCESGQSLEIIAGDVVAADRLSMFICRLKHTNLSQFILGKV